MFRYTKKTLVREIVMILACLLVLLPFYILVVTSLKSDSATLTTSPTSLPKHPTFGNFLTAWGASGQQSLVSGMLTSAIITVGTIIILVALGSVAAYTISRRPGRLGTAAYVGFLIGIILPFQLGMIPAYIALRSFGLIGNPIGLIVLYSGLLMPLAVFLYTGFARELPKDYEEAAFLDGATKFQTFRKIVFPMLSPATGTVVILCGLIIWNDFFTQLIFLSGSTTLSLPVVVYSYVGALGSRWNVIFAAIIISMLPVLIAYLVAQRRFIQGFAGGIKA